MSRQTRLDIGQERTGRPTDTSSGDDSELPTKPESIANDDHIMGRTAPQAGLHDASHGLVAKIKESIFAKAVATITVSIFGLSGIAYVIGATIWTDSILPRIDRFVMNEVNDYFSGALEKRTQHLSRSSRDNAALEKFLTLQMNDYFSGELQKRTGTVVEPSLVTKMEALATTVFGDVDSVYTVSKEYSLNSTVAPIDTYIYADPSKHDIKAVIYARGVIAVSGGAKLPFSFDFYVNGNKVLTDSRFDRDITDEIRQHPLQGTGGAGRDDDDDRTNMAMRYPEFIQLVSIKPRIQVAAAALANPERTVSIQGYILVTRKKGPSFSSKGPTDGGK